MCDSKAHLVSPPFTMFLSCVRKTHELYDGELSDDISQATLSDPLAKAPDKDDRFLALPNVSKLLNLEAPL